LSADAGLASVGTNCQLMLALVMLYLLGL